MTPPPSSTSTSAPTVVISGAAAGIGRATAVAFARRGYRVGAYDVDLAGLASLREQVTATGGDIAIGRLDVTDADDWALQLKEFTGPSRRLDILVNNAGVGGGTGTIEQSDTMDWRWVLDVNLMGVLYGTQTMVPLIKKQGEVSVQKG